MKKVPDKSRMVLLISVALAFIIPFLTCYGFAASFSKGVSLAKLAETTEDKIIQKKLFMQAGTMFGEEYLQNDAYDAAYSAALTFYKGGDNRTALRYLHAYLSRNPANTDALKLVDLIRQKNGSLNDIPQANQKKLSDYLLFRILPFHIFWLFLILSSTLLLCAVIWTYFKTPARLRIFNTPAYILLAFVGLFVIGRITSSLPYDGIIFKSNVVIKNQPAFSAATLKTENFFSADRIFDFQIEKKERAWLKIVLPNNKIGWIHSSSVEVFH